MAVELTVDIFDSDDEHLVRHVFFGETEADAEAKREAHAKQCHEFQRAEKEGRVYEMLEEIDDDELPDVEDYDDEEDEEEEAE